MTQTSSFMPADTLVVDFAEPKTQAVYIWITCEDCGKEYQKEVTSDVLREGRLGELARKVHIDHTTKWCRLCSAKHDVEMWPGCPESVIRKNGAGYCTLDRNHTGRCQPIEIPQEVIDRVRSARNTRSTQSGASE
jgi:hypothetical protein